MRKKSRTVVVGIMFIQSLALLTSCSDDSPPAMDAAEVETAEAGVLRSIMVELGIEMDNIAHGIWLNDLPSVAAAATAIAEHPHVSDTERARIQGALGTDFSDFIQSDRRVHNAAVRLTAAVSASASTGELTAVLDQLADLQASCVACHQKFRERLR